MADRRLTEEEFKRIWPKLASWGAKTVEAVRLVLVEGCTRKEACDQLAVSRQAIQQALKRVENILNEVPKGWVMVEIYAPPELAEKFLEQVRCAKIAQDNKDDGEER